MLSKMIEDALEAEQKAANLIAEVRKQTMQEELEFDTRVQAQLKALEEQTRKELLNQLQTAKQDHSVQIATAIAKNKQECETFLQTHNDLIQTVTLGVCQILTTSVRGER